MPAVKFYSFAKFSFGKIIVRPRLTGSSWSKKTRLSHLKPRWSVLVSDCFSVWKHLLGWKAGDAWREQRAGVREVLNEVLAYPAVGWNGGRTHREHISCTDTFETFAEHYMAASNCRLSYQKVSSLQTYIAQAFGVH